MSDFTRPELDALLVQLERDIAETGKLRRESEKFIAEQRKLIAEELKMAAEQRKFMAEEAKLTWDRRLSPLLALAAVIGGMLGAASFLAHFIR